MPTKYYIKLRINYKQHLQFHMVVVSIFANNKDEAMKKVICKVENWKDYKTAEILKISTDFMEVKNFVVEANLKYRNGSNRTIKLNLNAENENEAENNFRTTVRKWAPVVALQIIRIEMRD